MSAGTDRADTDRVDTDRIGTDRADTDRDTVSRTEQPGRLVTFDCFDTVLTRQIGSPRAVAYVTAHRLRRAGLLPCDVQVFVAARKQAEALVWRRAGDGHSLHDIAVQLVELLGLEESLAPTLVDTELAVEREHLRPVPSAVAEVAATRESGAQVGFLSDTPFSSGFLDELLTRHGVKQDGDLLWVSGELGAGKNRGGAYAAVAGQLPVVPRSWKHVGDDPRSDVRMAKLSGVESAQRQTARLNRFEQALDAAAPGTAGLSALLAGASRCTRLRLAEERPGMPAARASVVAGVAAPLLVGYVLWCFREARRVGARRLYFVARDGEAMLDVARRLAPAVAPELELHYLQGSRRAWLLPSMARLDRERLSSVLGREEVVTVRNCLGWVGVPPEQVRAQLVAAGFPEGSWDTALDQQRQDRVLDFMVGDDMAGLVEAGAAEVTDVTRRYLGGVGLLDDEPYVIVDIGWQGTVGRLLTAVLQSSGGRPPALECYYGLNLPSHEAPGRQLRGYMFDNWRDLGTGRTTDLWVALEMFTAAAHGRVEGYEADGDTVRPVHGEPNSAAIAWGLPDLRHGLDVFAEELARTIGDVDPWVDLRAVTDETLRMFWLEPTRSEVEAWQGYPFEADAETYPIARPFSTGEVVASIAQGRPRLRRRGTWPVGTRLAAPAHLRAVQGGIVVGRVTVAKLRRARQFWQARRLLRGGTPPAGTAAR